MDVKRIKLESDYLKNLTRVAVVGVQAVCRADCPLHRLPEDETVESLDWLVAMAIMGALAHGPQFEMTSGLKGIAVNDVMVLSLATLIVGHPGIGSPQEFNPDFPFGKAQLWLTWTNSSIDDIKGAMDRVVGWFSRFDESGFVITDRVDIDSMIPTADRAHLN